MRLLITGGAGFVGSTLAMGLAADGHEIVVMDNLKRRGSELQLPALAAAGVAFHHGDVRCPEDLAEIKKCDLLLECSAEPSVHAGYGSSPAYLLNSNLGGLINCLEYARQRQAGIILLSTSRVYPIAALRSLPLQKVGDRLDLENHYTATGCSFAGISRDFPLTGGRSLYGATKLAGELLLEEYRSMYGVPCIINRCGVIAGPGQMGKVEQGFVALWLARHLWGGPLAYTGFKGEGAQVRDILHVADLLDLIHDQIRTVDNFTGRPWNVGGGRNNSVSLRELTALCQKITGKTIAIASAAETNPADIPWYITDNSALNTHSGWTPTRNLERILNDMHEWLLQDAARLRPYFLPVDNRQQ